MSGRLLTDDQLADLARPPALTLVGLLERADLGAVASWASSIQRCWQAAVRGYHDWIAHTQAHLLDRHGPAALAALAPATGSFFARHPDTARSDGVDQAGRERVLAAAARADAASARQAFEDWAEPWRCLHDLHRDWLSDVLSHVYRTYGVDELEAAIRHAGEQTLLAWMPSDLARPPDKRIASWTRMLHGHFTVFDLTEDDDKFTIVQDPCGSCTRQILQGRYEPPVSLAMVDEPGLLTGGRGATPIYRTHVPVMHVAMPLARIGVPWPVNQCPAGAATGPCRILLFKDPYDPAAAAYLPSAAR